MPALWQITDARGHQTQGVWALVPGFTVGAESRGTHATAQGKVLAAATAAEDLENLLDAAEGIVRAEHAFFKAMNVVIAGRFASEVAAEDPLRRDIDPMRMRQDDRADIEERTLRTVAAWAKLDAARAAEDPPQPPVTVRGNTAAGYEARWQALPAKRQAAEVAAGDFRTGIGKLKAADKVLDRINKKWHQAWKSEHPPGTPERDALAGVTTEKSVAKPKVLEIAAVVQEGPMLRVTYQPGTGAHATVKDLNYQVKGVDGNFKRITADAAGNLIGPFEEGQSVRIRTDVGNSRYKSVPGPERVVVMGAVE